MGSKGGLVHSREGGNLVAFVFEIEKCQGNDTGLLPRQERRNLMRRLTLVAQYS